MNLFHFLGAKKICTKWFSPQFPSPVTLWHSTYLLFLLFLLQSFISQKSAWLMMILKVFHRQKGEWVCVGLGFFLDNVGLVCFPEQGKEWYTSQVLPSWTLSYFPSFLVFLPLYIFVLSDRKESRIFFLYKKAVPTVDHFGETHLLVESGLCWFLWNIACCSSSCIQSHLDGVYFFPSYLNHSLLKGTHLLSHTSVNFQQHLMWYSLPFHRGKPEIIGSNLDILVTMGLSEKACEDYRLPQEVCNVISKLASNPKVRLWVYS